MFLDKCKAVLYKMFSDDDYSLSGIHERCTISNSKCRFLYFTVLLCNVKCEISDWALVVDGYRDLSCEECDQFLCSPPV